MRRTNFSSWIVTALAGGLLPMSATLAAVDFAKDVKPILTAHCTACHGGVKKAGGLSFLMREDLLAPTKSGAIPAKPGKPEESEIVRRIETGDKDDRMPPPDHGEKLKDAEIATLKQWIAEGPTWTEHWAYQPPTAHPAPAVKDTGWPRTTPDAFILARLESENLRPSPEATPAEWLRRVSFDLTGLPPGPAEFDAFTADFSSDPLKARGSVVDRLLASPAFGERWASMWLDLARYSDTYGFEKDPHREIWPWRDWVIRAFNADMPFDTFTVKQLAGDLLENATGDDILATAFHRNTQNNTEGGTDDEEFRTAAVLDRVNTTWTAWQGTTFGCVMCHSHPYDPFPNADYYRFAAFFNNTEDADLNDDFPRFTVANDPVQRDAAARLQRDQRAKREAINDAGLKAVREIGGWQPMKASAATASGGTLTVAADGKIDASGTLPIGVSYQVTVRLNSPVTALRIDIFPDSSDPKKWPERGSVISHLAAAVKTPDGKSTPVVLKEVIADFLAGPFDPQEALDGGEGGFGGYPVLTGPRWCVVVPDQPISAPTGATLELTMKQAASINSGFQGTPVRHFTLAGSADVGWTAWVQAPERKQLWADFETIRKELGKIGGPKVPVLRERSVAGGRTTRIFTRGNRLVKGDAVEPGLPAVVFPPKKEGRLTRLDLAQWLVGGQNPLTARVLANRLWAEMFGAGIVESQEDFGTIGGKPSHPELLDTLAVRLSGDFHWSVKRFLKELALSATYAQTAKVTPLLAEKDPRNRLLARGPRTRLTAEMVRDQALAVSGLLSAKAFGPPVYPPQPDGIWSTVYSGDSWKTSAGEDRYRRAIYTYHRRTAGYPGFLTFDAPTRDACTPRRAATNTPLQALVTLNDPAFVELAQALAQRMESSGRTPTEQIAAGCRYLTLAAPAPAMVETLVRLREKSLAEFQTQPGSHEKLAATPETAALVLVANTLLNADAAMNR